MNLSPKKGRLLFSSNKILGLDPKDRHLVKTETLNIALTLTPARLNSIHFSLKISYYTCAYLDNSHIINSYQIPGK
jgi:hypothetical protein